MTDTFQLEQETEKAPSVNESRLARTEAWRQILVKLQSDTTTTTELSKMMNMETSAAYRAVKAMAREGLVSVIPPDKPGQPCAIIINAKVRFFKL
jgi:DNA-binding MarR family transcriptional regulator